MRYLVGLYIGLFCLCGSARAEEIPMTLDEAVSIALRDNRDIRMQAEDVSKAKAKIKEAQAGLFPSVTASATFADNRGVYSKDYASLSYQAGVKQVLYKGGKIYNAIKAGEYTYAASQAVLDAETISLILAVKKAFYTLRLSEEYIVVNKEILENARKHLAVAEARYAQGLVSESDVIAARTSVASVEEAYEASVNQQESSQVSLRAILFLGDTVTVKPAAEFAVAKEEIDLDEKLLQALKERPELRQYDAQTMAAKKSVEVAKADGRPNVYASWDYYGRSHSSSGTAKNWNDYNILGVTVSWPIFDGWATKAKVEQALIDVKQAQLMREKAQKDIIAELRGAYLALLDALWGMKTVESDIALYKVNLDTVEQKHQQGITSQLDVEDAELKYTVSIFNRKQAAYDYIIAKASLDKATGGSYVR